MCWQRERIEEKRRRECCMKAYFTKLILATRSTAISLFMSLIAPHLEETAKLANVLRHSCRKRVRVDGGESLQ